MSLKPGCRSGSDLSLSSSDACSSTQSLMSSDTCSRPSFDLLPDTLSLKPHHSSDFAFSAIRNSNSDSPLSFSHFRLLRRLGSGDIGTVYLCQLPPSECLYAMKVVDKDIVALKKKARRAETERNILRMLDHPFLPTLYAHFDASHFSCIVMEYCSGGDLHSLLHSHPNQRFPLLTARFYAAEVLVALEYLHMLGIIYRDLKPENVLLRSDGHIMLSDFDLALCSHAIPAVHSPSSSPDEDASSPSALLYSRPKRGRLSRLLRRLFRFEKIKTMASTNLPFLVAEPVAARSMSFVGTHEYVSPEVASGGSHGNAVDWWAFGVFLYEMVYGHTPFGAVSNEATLRNIVRKPLRFTEQAPRSMLELQARDLISRLLTKDPNDRLGSKHGAADVKRHPFFKGMNLALIRSMAPPEIPARLRKQSTLEGERRKSQKQLPPFDYF